MPTPTITVTVDTKLKTYTLTTDAPGGVITSGGPVVLQSSGATSVTLTSTPAGTPLEAMTATAAGATTTLRTTVTIPFSLSVVAAGYTSNSLTITPRFSLTLSSETPEPTINAGPGAQVVLTATAGTVTTPAGLFVSENGGTTLSMPTASTTVTIAAAATPGDNELSEPQAGPQVPLKGKINVGSTVPAF